MANVIGLPLDRVDGRKKVTGTAPYAAEFKPQHIAHAFIVQSTITNGTVLEIDTREAGSMRGVIAIMTPDNAPRLKPAGQQGNLIPAPLLQDKDVLYNGSHVAVVIAETLERAQEAAGRVRVRYQQGEFNTDMAAVMSQAYPPKKFRNGVRPPDSSRGDPDGAFASAPVQVEGTWTTPVEHHNPMEPHATIARWDGDKLTIWTATQGITGVQTTMSTLFGIPRENVRVIDPYVGGGFGSKGSTWPPATLAAMAAKLVQRPVKLVLSRAQMYTSNGYRPRTIQKIKLGAQSDGTLVALRHDGFSQMGSPKLGEFSEPVALASEMLYNVPNAAVTHRVVAVDQGLPTYMRAPGEAPGVFAIESAMDELASRLKMDPVELRLKNYTDIDLHEKKPFPAKKLRECYQIGAERFGWSRRTAEPRSMRDGRFLVGYGMATATYPTNRQPAQASARLNADGTLIVRSGTQDLGTGTYTVMSQVASDELGVPMARIRFELGDSSFPHAPVSGGSTTVASVAPAVQAACVAVREKLFDLALADPRAGLHGIDRTALRLASGVIIGGGKRVRVDEVLARAGQDHIEAQAGAKPGDEKEHYSLHAWGAQFAEVRVDPDLGEIRVARYLGVFDGGRVLNAKTARSQLIGGITYGIGMALLEQTIVDNEIGRIYNANLAEYLVPVHADVPHIETVLVENNDPVANPLGARGLGELPMVGVAAAIANAVYHATGRRVRNLPIRIEDVMI